MQLAAIARGDADGGAAWGASAPAAAGEVQARVDAAVAHTRRHVFARRVLPLVGLATVALVAAIVGFSRSAAPTVAPAVMRMSVRLPEGRILGATVRTMALSPTGNELAYLTDTELLIRRLSEFELEPVAVADLGGTFNRRSSRRTGSGLPTTRLPSAGSNGLACKEARRSCGNWSH